ncbi:protein PTHB1-like [Penaeus indicus]|uniref:protein PTHB1-like n=1 Tax=Penaeus indicus TaxID=29960 RepID=UPI00300D889D
MSLFKARDWWSTVVQTEGGEEEECDAGCLVIANINNEDPPKDKIVVGGFSGSLRIFSPQAFRSEEGQEVSGFRPDHVLLETTFNYPIIHLAVGKFVSSNDLLHLCVLHPDRMAVYTLTVTSGQGGHGDSSKLSVAYQHKFQRHAHSLTTGPFGGVKGKDYIAVQSLDGCITVFEQESFAFSSFLPGFLLPGPLVYVAKSDSLITVGSDWSLQCYKYQAVAVATDNEKEMSNNKTGGRRLTAEWTRQLGEPALDILVINPPEGPTNILILTHHSIFCYKESGVLKFVKKLEYNPSCFTAYLMENAVYLCVATHTQTLLVYKEAELKWASQLPFTPVVLSRADFPGIKGALVFLGDAGQLQASYLGTDPSLFVAPPAETREINYDQTDKELAQLHKIIKASTKDTGTLVGMNRGDGDLIVSGTVGTQLEKWPGSTRVQDIDGGVPAVPVVIRLTAHTPLNTVRVNIAVEKPLTVTQDTFVLRTICDTSQIMVKFYLADQYIPTSLSVGIVTSYITHTGAPRIITTNLDLPLRLVAKLSAPNKEADHKITISTNKPAVNLPELFPDYSLDGSVTTALGLQYFGGPSVTILSSRTTNRYRLQSDSLPSVWVILSEVVRRLKSYWGHSSRKDGEELVLGVASSLPISELFCEIDAHFLRRKKHEELMGQLVQRATQFRAVQRRLLTKFKDKTPTPLTNLDNLLEGTYKQILQITDVINDNIRGLEEDGCQLSCAVRLILELVRLSVGMSDQHFALLSAAISPIVHTSMDQGWEEATDASVTFLLRTVLGKGSRDAAVAPELTMPSDTSKLKKHLDLLLNKIMKGGVQLAIDNSGSTNNTDTHKVINSDEEEDYVNSKSVGKVAQKKQDEENETDIPLGSRLGEDRARSARIRSARLMSARKISQRSPGDGESVTMMEGSSNNPIYNEDIEDRDSPVNSSSFPEDQNSLENFPEEESMEKNEEESQEEEKNDEESPVEEKNEEESPEEEKNEDEKSVMEFSEVPFNGSIEALKKETMKENLIESPADIFATGDVDDIW